MDYVTKTKRLEYLLELIKKEQLTCSSQLANNFDCSSRTIRNLINILRQQGHNIKYCKTSKKYLIKDE
jgi:DeoR/GlpR family transcriptional regulator of sugar metabolism